LSEQASAVRIACAEGIVCMAFVSLYLIEAENPVVYVNFGAIEKLPCS